MRRCARRSDVVEREFRDLVALIELVRFHARPPGAHRHPAPGEGRALWASSAWRGRASGVDLDVRRDHPYAAYGHLTWRVPVYQEGDVLRRMQVRIDEVRESIAHHLRGGSENLPAGPHRVAVGRYPPGRCALSAVEGWRGEILHWIRTGPGNRLERCKIKDPSLNNWPALVEAVQGNIIADFPVINKSFNLSYSGTDR